MPPDDARPTTHKYRYAYPPAGPDDREALPPGYPSPVCDLGRRLEGTELAVYDWGRVTCAACKWRRAGRWKGATT